MPTLAQLDLAPAAERGPDVLHQVTLPADWLAHGATVECELPRRLRCARCEGGGCDRCARSGAIVLAEVDEAPRRVVLHLSPGAQEARGLRLLEEGGLGAAAAPRGCLILHIAPGPPGAGVRRLDRGSRVGAAGLWAVLAVLIALALAAVLFASG